MMSDRLSFYIQDLRSGGAERSVVRLLNGIAERGISVDLVVVQKKGPYFSELDPRVRVIELPQSRTVSSILGLRKYFVEVRPRAVVSSMTHCNIAAIIARATARYQPRLVVVEHNNFLRNKSIRSGLARKAYDLVPFLYRRADVVAVVAEEMRSGLAAAARFPQESIRVLYNPVVTPELCAAAQEEPVHPWLREGDRPVFVSVGRLVGQKNFSLLIRAFAKLRQRADARLVIFGEGELRPQLAELVASLGLQSDVDMPGFFENPFSALRCASAFVLSSDWEGLPTVVIEALACGCPIVATDCETGPREILQDGALGTLVRVGDEDALAEAMLNAIGNPGDREPRRARAEFFNVESAVNRYLLAAGLVD